MSNIFNPKTEKTPLLISNIKTIKIIAIILGFLIIVGLLFLFWGLAKNYSKLNNKTTVSESPKIDKKLPNTFIFNEPAEAQLISSSIGPDSQILLRYLYKGENTLVILDHETNKIHSVITIKKSNVTFKID
tara:strand:+ start:420 stop:812 length:393 start_codon:yes stop_codon:yes gene_type:complete